MIVPGSIVLSNPARARASLVIFEKKALLRLVFKNRLVREGVVTELDFYEPFKLFISGMNLECLTK